jgi:hypothetical protein
MEVFFHALLTSVIDGGELSAKGPSRFTLWEGVPFTHWVGGGKNPRGLDMVVKKKISVFAGKWTPIFRPYGHWLRHVNILWNEQIWKKKIYFNWRWSMEYVELLWLKLHSVNKFSVHLRPKVSSKSAIFRDNAFGHKPRPLHSAFIYWTRRNNTYNCLYINFVTFLFVSYLKTSVTQTTGQ